MVVPSEGVRSLRAFQLGLNRSLIQRYSGRLRSLVRAFPARRRHPRNRPGPRCEADTQRRHLRQSGTIPGLRRPPPYRECWSRSDGAPSGWRASDYRSPGPGLVPVPRGEEGRRPRFPRTTANQAPTAETGWRTPRKAKPGQRRRRGSRTVDSDGQLPHVQATGPETPGSRIRTSGRHRRPYRVDLIDTERTHEGG